MIVGSAEWTAWLKSEAKQALYYYEIPDEGIVITSFVPRKVNVTVPAALEPMP